MKRIGDLATQLSEELREEHEKAIGEDPALLRQDEDVMLESKRSILARINFRWRPSDQLLLDRIRIAADGIFDELFSGTVKVLDNVYASVREIELNNYDIPRTDERGRPIWKRDERGNYIENWNNLDGSDIDRALFDLARIRLLAAPKVNELLMDALFAKRLYTDAKDDAFAEMIDGTIQDKTSSANRKVRQDNYHAFFRFVLWSQGDVFLKEIANLQRILERVRDQRIYSQR